MPQDDLAYQFMDNEHAEGKLCFIYMTAGTNKFLCIYYSRVNEPSDFHTHMEFLYVAIPFSLG